MTWRYLFGAIVLILGLGFLLEQTHLIATLSFYDILAAWWPLVIVAIGLNQLIRDMERPWGSLVVFGAGLVLLVRALGPTHAPHNLPAFFAGLLLLIVGIRFILPQRKRQSTRDAIHEQSGVGVRYDALINESQFFGGVRFRNESQHFKGGKVNAVFGEAEVDLRGAVLPRDGADLRLMSVFGTITVRVPQEMAVEINGVPFLGTMENKTRPLVGVESGRPKLRIQSAGALSAVEIAN